MTGALAGFLTVVLLAYLVPGPDFAVVLRASGRGMWAGRVAALGAQTGLCVHMLAAILGISAVLAHSAEAFTVVKLLGAAYLCYLGVRALLASRGGASTTVAPAADTSLAGHFVRGLLSNVLNPKAALFFLSLVPQFVDHNAPVTPQILLLGTLDVVVGVAYWLIFVQFAGTLTALITRDRVRRMLDRVTGGVFVALGVGLAGAEV
ncbi:LysE family translocator [Pseudonocardia spinosispora]|uniref:LysE family translocator n=1 Tax=Pseudonocardia spinosispora TaxID=103441 RepID=UPI00048D6821|nr:LysE family translocator [Pseudonocardia spinosispora]